MIIIAERETSKRGKQRASSPREIFLFKEAAEEESEIVKISVLCSELC
jgi:hypothetical protein